MGTRGIDKNITLYEDDAAGFRQWQGVCRGNGSRGQMRSGSAAGWAPRGRLGMGRRSVEQDGAGSRAVLELTLVSHLGWCLSKIGLFLSTKICVDSYWGSKGLASVWGLQ